MIALYPIWTRCHYCIVIFWRRKTTSLHVLSVINGSCKVNTTFNHFSLIVVIGVGNHSIRGPTCHKGLTN